MDALSSTLSYENERNYNQTEYENCYSCELDEVSSEMSQYMVDGVSLSSEEYYSIYEQSSCGSFIEDYEDLMSNDFYFYENDSSFGDYRSDTETTVPSSSNHSVCSYIHHPKKNATNKPIPNGILKRRDINSNNRKSNISQIDNEEITAVKITDEVIDKIRESELEDVLQYAKDIVNPDPTAKLTFSPQPAKVVKGSFKHLLSIKEVKSKTGAFKYRTVEIPRSNNEEDLGFSVRQGDGWEKKDGIFISRVSLGSVFDQYEILTVGDELIQVNKVDVRHMTVDDVIRLMYIPEKLSVTIKMLTPFSQKRIEKSGLGAFAKFQKKKFIPQPESGGYYKVAQLKIGANDKRHVSLPKRTILVKNKQGKQQIGEKKSVKISPYRTMENGKQAPLNKGNLSPIREVSSEPRLNKVLASRRQSYVTWSDQRSLNSEPYICNQ